MPYHVEFTKQAQREFNKLEAHERQIIAAFIDQHLDGSQNPCADPRAKRLQGVPHGWRWRVGVWRILATVESQRVLIRVFRVGHRREVYQKL